MRLPLAATNEGHLAQVIGSSRCEGYDRMEGITAPTLVVHGELDALIFQENGRIISGRIPGAELVVIPNANHLRMADRPEHVSQVLVDRLDRNR